MQKFNGIEWLSGGQKKDFYYFADSNNASSQDFANAITNCNWAAGGIIGIVTSKSFYWSNDPQLTRHSALVGATKQPSIARLETKENGEIHGWAVEKSHLKNFALLLSIQRLPADLKCKLYSVADFHQSQNANFHFYGKFQNLYSAIPKIK